MRRKFIGNYKPVVTEENRTVKANKPKKIVYKNPVHYLDKQYGCPAEETCDCKATWEKIFYLHQNGVYEDKRTGVTFIKNEYSYFYKKILKYATICPRCKAYFH